MVKDKTVQAEIGGYLDCAAHSFWQRSRHCIRRHQSAFHHHSFTGIYDTDGKASHETRGIEKDTGDKGYPDEQPEIGFTYDHIIGNYKNNIKQREEMPKTAQFLSYFQYGNLYL